LDIQHDHDPTGLVPVVKEVDVEPEAPTSTLASTGSRPVGGNQVIGEDESDADL